MRCHSPHALSADREHQPVGGLRAQGLPLGEQGHKDIGQPQVPRLARLGARAVGAGDRQPAAFEVQVAPAEPTKFTFAKPCVDRRGDPDVFKLRIETAGRSVLGGQAQQRRDLVSGEVFERVFSAGKRQPLDRVGWAQTDPQAPAKERADLGKGGSDRVRVKPGSQSRSQPNHVRWFECVCSQLAVHAPKIGKHVFCLTQVSSLTLQSGAVVLGKEAIDKHADRRVVWLGLGDAHLIAGDAGLDLDQHATSAGRSRLF